MLRALGGLGPFTVSVAVENLQPHDKGATFSIVTRLEDQLGLLWVGDSKVLCRGVKVPGEIPPKAEQEPLPLEPIDNWKAPADIGRRYARAAGDYNPIHLSAPSAKLFGFPRAIAHGLWNKARSLAALGERLPASGYRVEVRFQKPVLLPASLTLLASAAAADGQFSLRGKDDLPHMAGHWSRLQADAGPPYLKLRAQSPKLCGCLPPPRRIPMDLHELTARLHAIRDRNDWRQFHSPEEPGHGRQRRDGRTGGDLPVADGRPVAHAVGRAARTRWPGSWRHRPLSAAVLRETGLDLEQVVRAKLADCERRFLP